MPAMNRVVVNVSEELERDVKRRAKREGISVSELIRHALKQFLEEGGE